MLIIMLPNQDLRADLPGMHAKMNKIPATWNTQTYCLSMKFTPITPMCCKFSTLFPWILPHVVLQIDILKDPWSQGGCHSLWIPSIRFNVVPYAYFVCDMLLTKLSSFWWPTRLWTLRAVPLTYSTPCCLCPPQCLSHSHFNELILWLREHSYLCQTMFKVKM